MAINLSKLFNRVGERLEIDETFDFGNVEWLANYPFTAPVKVVGHIYNNAGTVILKATIEFDYTAPCDRCARESTTHMTVPVKHVLVEDSDEDYEDDNVIGLENFHLDLKELVLSDILLSLPMIILCKPDCAGVCLNCGRNLNEGKCNCKA